MILILEKWIFFYVYVYGKYNLGFCVYMRIKYVFWLLLIYNDDKKMLIVFINLDFYFV